MIIGNNQNNQNNAFNAKMNTIKQNAENTKGIVSPISHDTMQHKDILNKNDMNDKAFAMLQERLNNGLISIEEFNKKCTQLGKRYK